MFEGFRLERIELPEATLRVRHGGSGPPVLLLHGHPRTHATWRRVAPQLAACHTVVCPDLRGFGQSSKPVDRPNHAGSSKRAKARDGVALMRYPGFERFAVVGHDRGSYVAFHMALDHPDAITHLAVLDGVPILAALERWPSHVRGGARRTGKRVARLPGFGKPELIQSAEMDPIGETTGMAG